MQNHGDVGKLIRDLGEIPIFTFGKPKEPVMLKDLEEGIKFDVAIISSEKDIPFLGSQTRTELYHNLLGLGIYHKEVLESNKLWIYAEKVWNT